MDDNNQENSTLELATELTIAWLSNPNTRASAEEVPSFLQQMHQAVQDLASPADQQEEEPAQQYTPAVSARKSLASKDHIISMIDGKSYKTLRRHLARHGLTPEQYRERYNLKADYPMVSENYSQARRDMARNIGLGRKRAEAASDAPAEASGEGAPAPRAPSRTAEAGAGEPKAAPRARRKKTEPATAE